MIHPPAELSRASVIIRILTDVAVIVATLAVSLTIRDLLGSDTGVTDDDGTPLLPVSAGIFILASITVNVFFLSGFYRRNRNLQPAKKFRAVIRGIAISHLLFAFVLLMLIDLISFPRSVLLMNAVLATVSLTVIRLGLPRLSVGRRFLDWVDGLDPHEEPLRKVLVVGGGGYIGSALLARLLQKGYRVRLLDMLMFGEEPIADLIDHPNLEIHRGDFRQVDKVVRAMAGVDAVVHLGAIVGDPACEIDHELTIDTNLLATRMVAEVAEATGVRRFVFASTCSVYGAGDEILDENSELNPVSLYAQSKIACEEVLLSMEELSPVVLRFGTIYGLSGRTRFDLVVNLLTAKAVTEGRITVFGGDQWRPFVHVDDAAKAIVASLEAPHAIVNRNVFNVGSDEQNMTIDQVGDLIHEMVQPSEIVHLGSDGDRRDYRVDFSRIRKELKFTPDWTLEMGIQQVIDAIRSGRVEDYTERKFSNVKSLQQVKSLELAQLEPQVIDLRTVTAPSAPSMQYSLGFDRDDQLWAQTLVRRKRNGSGDSAPPEKELAG